MKGVTAFVTLLLVTLVTGEKLSVLIPNQNTEFELDHEVPEVDVRASLSTPLGAPLPPTPRLVQAAPPAPVPTSAPGFRVPVPEINALYELPDAESQPQGQCQANTVTLTSTAQIFSTSVSLSQVFIPTTVYDRVTSTSIQYQTSYQTSYITVQGPAQTLTRTVTREVVVPQTNYVTTTRFQQQYITTTLLQTQVVTSRYVQSQYVTVTQTVTTSLLRYITTTLIRPTYVTQTAFITPSCAGNNYGSGSSSYYGYGSGTEEAVAPGVSGYYGGSEGHGYYGPFYGPYYASHQQRPKSLLGRKTKFLGRLVHG